MTTDLTKHREAALRVQQKYQDDVAAIRGDADLSDEGRGRRLAEVYAKTQRELSKLGESEQVLLAERQRKLEAELYSPPRLGQDHASHAISMRDAADRAAMVESPEQARKLMTTAEANGDTVMARALLRHIVDRPSTGRRGVDEGWAEVARDYVERHGEVQAVVQELADIETMNKRQVFSPFHAQQPHGVAPQLINQANGALVAAGEA